MPLSSSGFLLSLEIEEPVVRGLLLGSENLFPDEFIALLQGEIREARGERVVCARQLLLAPLAQFGPDSSSFSPLNLPLTSHVVGSFHSHPSPNSAYPSRQDRFFFASFGAAHLIACPPFTVASLAAFSPRGSPIPFRVTRGAPKTRV